MLFITGPSGAGKTTLLRLIGALERPDKGSITIGGQDITKMHPNSLPFLRRNFGLIFQDLKLLMDRNVFDNVALPLFISGPIQHENFWFPFGFIMHSVSPCETSFGAWSHTGPGMLRSLVNNSLLVVWVGGRHPNVPADMQ